MTGDTLPPHSGLHFPVFLLPGLKFPFRRARRPSSPVRTAETPSSPPVPSLSSSPISPTSLSTSPASPVSFCATRLARVGADTLRCNNCSTDIALVAQIVSKGFTGRHGRAYLVSPPSALGTSPPHLGAPISGAWEKSAAAADDLVNVVVGPSESRVLVTGQHVVADFKCAVCGVKLGWKYVDAREASQKYKVGKFIVETQRVAAFRSWEDVEVDVFRDEGTPVEELSERRSLSRSRASRQLGPAEDDGEEDDEEIVFDSDDEDECDDIFAGTWNAQTVAKRRKSKVSSWR